MLIRSNSPNTDRGSSRIRTAFQKRKVVRPRHFLKEKIYFSIKECSDIIESFNAAVKLRFIKRSRRDRKLYIGNGSNEMVLDCKCVIRVSSFYIVTLSSLRLDAFQVFYLIHQIFHE